MKALPTMIPRSTRVTSRVWRIQQCLLIIWFALGQVTSANAAGWSGASLVREIYPAPGHNGVFIRIESHVNPDGCASPSYYFLEKSNVLFNQIFALLMAAQARQAAINLQLVGCGGNNNLHPIIYQVIAS